MIPGVFFFFFFENAFYTMEVSFFFVVVSDFLEPYDALVRKGRIRGLDGITTTDKKMIHDKTHNYTKLLSQSRTTVLASEYFYCLFKV